MVKSGVEKGEKERTKIAKRLTRRDMEGGKDLENVEKWGKCGKSMKKR